MLVRTKAILLDLYLKGEAGDNPKAVEHSIKTIEDFLSVAVFNKSIMDKESQQLEVYLDPLRKAVSSCYIALNPSAAIRDCLEGVLQNMTRALTKFQTNISTKDVTWGYKEIITEGPVNPMKIAKYDQLNKKFRFSNVDVARISEGLKSGTSGIRNYENALYWTVRTPDYLNRMVLFAA